MKNQIPYLAARLDNSNFFKFIDLNMNLNFIFLNGRLCKLKSKPKNILMKSVKSLFTITILGLSLSLSAQNLTTTKVKDLLLSSKAGLVVPELKQQYVVSDAYYDQNTNINYIYLQQTCKGVKVYNAIKVIALVDNKVAYTSGKFVSQIDKKVQSSTPVLSATDAVYKAAAYLQLNTPVGLSITEDQFTSNHKIAFTDAGIAKEKIEAELLWVSTDNFNTVSLGWNINIDDVKSADWWNVRVNALNGDFIDKNNWTVTCNYGHHDSENKSAAENKLNQFKQLKFNHLDFKTNSVNKLAACPPLNISSASYYVIPFPRESPAYGPLATETNPWLKAGVGNNATTYAWNFDGTTNYNITKGNNVWAYDDSLGKNSPGRFDTSTTALPNLTFGLVSNFTLAPTTPSNRKAATTNLFYWNNIIHDITYQYGFDEVGGNFQKDNISRGGIGNDYVKAEAQDGSGTDNANFSTPADGGSGRMQMFLWTHTPKLDGDFDDGVMVHEYGHGISNRLTGGPSQAGCLSNAEQGGEGWSDYLALMFVTRWDSAKLTDGTLKRPIGNYVVGQTSTGKGIRTFPYSTSKTINKHTYSDIAGTGGGTVGEVHYIGEVWCSALWDMTWNIIQQEGSINANLYDANGGGGNTIAFKLVMQGMKLQPCLPGFLEARDAILAADSILYNNKHKCAIWKAFAARGMGFSAKQGSSGSVTDQKQATDVPSSVVFSAKYDPIIMMQNQPVTIPLKTNCSCKAPTKNYTIKATLPAGVNYTSGTGTVAGNLVSFNPINFLVTNASDSQSMTITASGAACKIDSVINDNRDNRTIGGFANNNIAGLSNWTTTNAYYKSPSTAWWGYDDTLVADFSLNSTAFTPKALSILSFQHLYEFENSYDGSLVEYSTDNGSNWLDAKSLIFKNPYNGFIDSISVSSIPNRAAYSGTTSGKFVQSFANLSSLAGTSTLLRFRVSTDLGNSTGAANVGWVLDDISVANGCGGFMKLVAYDSANKVIDSASVPIFITPNTVPVKYASFTAQQVAKQSLLRWIAAEEVNTSKYIIERSSTTDSWSAISTIAALGITNKEYTFYDEAPFAGLNYYRIKGLDKDGKVSYTEIRKLNFSKEGNQVLIVPNPSRYQSKVYVPSAAKTAKVSLFDAQSKIVKSFNQTLENGGFNLSTTDLTTGVYIIQILTEDGSSFIEKLMIEK